MPRKFTKYEKNNIIKRLREAAIQSLAQYGIRKTTVDEITRQAGIAKGSFYQFYDSKEMLFLEVIYLFHDDLQRQLMRDIKLIRVNLSPEKLTDLIYGLFNKVESSFLYPVMMSGELDRLIRMLPDDKVRLHTDQDELNMKKLREMFPEMDQAKVEVYSAALRGIFLSSMFKREIGEAVFPDALRAMIHGIVLQMFLDDKPSKGDCHD